MEALSDLPAVDAERPAAAAADTVDLWCFFYEEALQDAARRQRYAALMTPDEQARHQRYHFEKDRRLFLATRALVRTVLSRYAATSPADWRFVCNEYGKPRIAGEATQLHFNLSNTRGLVVCAVSKKHHALGVDAENVRRDSETVAIADRFFSPSEVRALHAQPHDKQRERFFSYWTLKESYIKARGMGLAIPLGDFSFELDAGRDITIGFTPQLDDDPARWQFALLRASADHFVAVGVAAERLTLRATTFTP